MQRIVIVAYGYFALSQKAIALYCQKVNKPYYLFDEIEIDEGDEYRYEYEPVSELTGPSSEVFPNDFACFDIPNPNDLNKEENDKHRFCFHRIERNDPALVATIEELGNEAPDNIRTKLVIVEIPDGVQYDVRDYECASGEYVVERHREWHFREGQTRMKHSNEWEFFDEG